MIHKKRESFSFLITQNNLSIGFRPQPAHSTLFNRLFHKPYILNFFSWSKSPSVPEGDKRVAGVVPSPGFLSFGVRAIGSLLILKHWNGQSLDPFFSTFFKSQIGAEIGYIEGFYSSNVKGNDFIKPYPRWFASSTATLIWAQLKALRQRKANLNTI
jgi:hypothetical protein